MSRESGRLSLEQRYDQLGLYNRSRQLSNAEREMLVRQMAELTPLMSPERIASNRINSRLYLAEYLQANQSGWKRECHSYTCPESISIESDRR